MGFTIIINRRFYFYSNFRIILVYSKEPDKTQHYARANLGLHCLPMTPKWDTKLQNVNRLICKRGLSVAV